MRVEEMFDFVRERELVAERRAAGLPRPWTQDPILQSYRFCRMYREEDAVSTWLRRNWREPHFDDPDLWFAMAVARHVNNIPCLADLDFPLPWRPERFLEMTRERRLRGDKVFSPAYMISTNGNVTDSKTDYLCTMVFNPMWALRETLRPKLGDTLCSYHILLGQLFGLASFLAAQIVADVKYVEPLRSAADWSTFAASGPGSRRGLNRVLGKPVMAPWREDDWRLALGRLRDALLPMFSAANMPEPHAQDVQNMLCEFDKMERVRLGEGKPKQLFPGREGAAMSWSRQLA